MVSSIPMTVKVTPFIDYGWLKPGVFVSSTDMGLPFDPSGLSTLDRIIIDDFEQEASMSDTMAPLELIQGDIMGLVSDNDLGRKNPEERTLFLFRAVVLGDLALSALAYELAMEKKVGTSIPWSSK